MRNSDRVLLSGVALQVVALLLTGLFTWLGINVELIGWEDGSLTLSELLHTVGLVVLFFSNRVKESISMFMQERRNAKIAKRNR